MYMCKVYPTYEYADVSCDHWNGTRSYVGERQSIEENRMSVGLNGTEVSAEPLTGL
jgi:hypothetical protein